MKYKTQIKLNAILAIVFGILLMAGETYRRLGDWGIWSRWMDDYIMGLFLIIPAILILRGSDIAKKILIGGWAFNAGLLYGSFFSKVYAMDSIQQSNFAPSLLVKLIGLAFFTSVIALIWILVLEGMFAHSPKENN